MTPLRKKLSDIIYDDDGKEPAKGTLDQIIQAITELIEEAVGEEENPFDVGEDLTNWEHVEYFRNHVKSNLLKGVKK